METDSWPPLTEEQKKFLDVTEITVVCAICVKSYTEGLVPYRIILKRCEYVSNLLKTVNPECSKLCYQASQADKPSIFLDNCKKSTEMWNALLKKMKEEESRRTGIA